MKLIGLLEFIRLVAASDGLAPTGFVHIDPHVMFFGKQICVLASRLCEFVNDIFAVAVQEFPVSDVLTQKEQLETELVLSICLDDEFFFRSVAR